MKLLDAIFPARAARLSVGELLGQLWVMEPGAVEAFVADLHRAREALASAGELRAAIGHEDEGEERPLEVVDGVAHLRVEGPIVKRVPSWARYYGVRMAGAQDVQRDLARALADTRVRSILLVVDSPGGTLGGVQELGDALYAARAVKPVYGYASDQAASAGYWVLSQASRISANRAAAVGSIGVFVVIADASKMYEQAGVTVHVVRAGEHKGAGTWGAPITDAQLAQWQGLVDGAARLFVEAVARGRGLAPDAAQALATGALWYADDAVGMRLIDAVESIDVAHTACASAMLEAPKPADELPPDDGEDDDAEPAEHEARTDLPAEAAASDVTPNTEAPTGAEGATMTTKSGAGAAGTSTPLSLEEQLAQLRADNERLSRDAELARREAELSAKAGVVARREQLIEAAIADGRLAPAMRGDAESYAEACGADVARLERWLGSLQASIRSTPRGASPVRPVEAGASGSDTPRADAQVARRLQVNAKLFETASAIDHYTADGKVVLQDGSIRELREFAPPKKDAEAAEV